VEVDEVEEQAVTRGLLVSGFICNSLGAGSAPLSLRNFLGALSVRIICRSRWRGCCHQTRPSGRMADGIRINSAPP